MNERKLLFQNPATLLFLGAVPALGASADLRAALGMSAAVLGVLLLSALILGLLRNLIPSGARLPAALLVVAGCASAAQLLLHALLPSAWEMLGFYAAVLAVDLMLFASAEDALDFPLGKSLCSALISGLKKLARENYADLSPSPLLVKLEYSHPTLSQRIEAIEQAGEPRN